MEYLLVFAAELFILFFLARKIMIVGTKMLYALTARKNLSIYLYSFLIFPGTFIHELSHFLASIVLFVPVKGFSLLPKIEEDSIKLGHVTIQKTDILRSTIVSAAPFAVGIAGILLLSSYFFKLGAVFGGNITLSVLGVYSMFVLGSTMYLSKADMKAITRLFLVVLVMGVAAYFLGFELIGFSKNIFLNPEVVEFLRFVSLLMLMPIGINIALFFFVGVGDRFLSN